MHHHVNEFLDLTVKGAGGGSQSGGSWKLILWCCLTEVSEMYQMLLTSSKNIDPSPSYDRLKVSAHVLFYCTRDFRSRFPENEHFFNFKRLLLIQFSWDSSETWQAQTRHYLEDKFRIRILS